MANFAKAQLLKYGWTEGKGLGKNESGISEAIKPKLKFDHAGIGHDSAEQFTYHWWENVFNEAAKNISVESDKDGVSMKVIDEDTVDISTKKSSLKALKKNHRIQYGNFLKTSTLLNDGKVLSESSEESKITDTLEPRMNNSQLTDEDLFKACGGRTAHKGARHGLNLNGKLARIAEQERQLLAKMKLDKMEKIESSSKTGKDYGHEFETVKSRKRVKSKRKMVKTDPESATNVQETVSEILVNETDPQPSCSYTIDPDAEENLDALKSKRKTKKSKKNDCELGELGNPLRDLEGLKMTRSNQSGVDDNANTVELDDEFVIPPITEEPVHRTRSKKGRKKERRKINDLSEQLDTSCVIDESIKTSKKRRREESQQVVEEILITALENCGPAARKCKKPNAEESSNRNTYQVDKLNAKISKKKKRAAKKKRKDKLDSITKELMLVNLEESSENKNK